MSENKIVGEDAVKRAYLTMKEKIPENAAFESAVRVARFHHPMLSKSESVDLTANILGRKH